MATSLEPGFGSQTQNLQTQRGEQEREAGYPQSASLSRRRCGALGLGITPSGGVQPGSFQTPGTRAESFFQVTNPVLERRERCLRVRGWKGWSLASILVCLVSELILHTISRVLSHCPGFLPPHGIGFSVGFVGRGRNEGKGEGFNVLMLIT